MFTAHHSKTYQLLLSNSYDRLFHRLAETIQTASPFERQLVFTPSLATQYDLQKRLSKQLGICMGVDFCFLEAGLKRILKLISKSSMDEKGLDLALTLQKKLEELASGANPFDKKEELHDLLEYLSSYSAQEQEALISIADELSSLFKQYSLYAQDVHKWNDGEARSWQQFLYQKCWQKDSYTLNPRFFMQGEAALIQQKLKVHCFALPQYPQLFIDLFLRFQSQLDLHVYFLSPTPLFWGDLKSQRENKFLIKKLQQEQVKKRFLDDLNHYEAKNHPLLANWGTLGRKGFEALEALPFTKWTEDFVFNETLSKEPFYEELLISSDFTLTKNQPTLLDRLKADMMTLQVPHSMPLKSLDDSFQVKEALSRQREVQHLKEQLFALIDQTPSLSFDQIAIYIVDIEKYLIHLQAEFVEKTTPFPILIHDQPFALNNPLFRGFSDLIQLSQKGWDAKTWIQLIQNPTFILSKRLNENEREALVEWIEKIGVLWGHDDGHLADVLKQSYGCPLGKKEKGLSWQYFFESCLNLALTKTSNEHLDPFLNKMNLSDLGILNELYTLTESLKVDLELFNSDTSATFEEWSLYLSCFIESYFIEDSFNRQSLIQRILEMTKRVQKQKETPFSFQTFWYYLSKDLSTFRPEVYHRTMNALSFYSLFSRPFLEADYTFVLGLDEDSFPRNPLDSTLESWNEFNVLGGRPKVVEEDRYQFLQLLLCTHKKLSLSFTSKNPRTGKALHPSPLVEELLAYCQKFYPLEDKDKGDSRVEKIPILPFDSSYFEREKSSAHSFELTKAFYFTPKKQTRSPFAAVFDQPSFFSSNTAVFQSKIQLHSFFQFFKNPLSIYFQNHHALISRGDIWDNKYKPFILSGFEKTLLRRSLLKERSFFEQYPFQTHGMFRTLSEKLKEEEEQKLNTYLKSEGIKREEMYAMELRCDIDAFLQFSSSHYLAKAFEFLQTSEKQLQFEGLIEQITPNGLISLGKPQFRTLWTLFPILLITSLVHKREGKLFEEAVHFPLSNKKISFELSHKEDDLRALCLYYQFGWQKPCLLIPDWIPYFMDLPATEIQKALEKEVQSNHFYPEEMKDLFYNKKSVSLDHLEHWKSFCRQVLIKPYERIAGKPQKV